MSRNVTIAGVKFQSTLPRGERRAPMSLLESHCLFQSTLPRGERPAHVGNFADSISVSIHAPAWGATSLTTQYSQSGISFNPRSRVGSDRRVWHLHTQRISFNPRSRVGSDVDK